MYLHCTLCISFISLHCVHAYTSCWTSNSLVVVWLYPIRLVRAAILVKYKLEFSVKWKGKKASLLFYCIIATYSLTTTTSKATKLIVWKCVHGGGGVSTFPPASSQQDQIKSPHEKQHIILPGRNLRHDSFNSHHLISHTQHQNI